MCSQNERMGKRVQPRLFWLLKNKNKRIYGFWHFGITAAFPSGVLMGITREFFQWGKIISHAINQPISVSSALASLYFLI
jgi:hypothetical protein